MNDLRQPLDNVVLTTLAINGLEFAAARRSGRPLGTADLLLGMFDADETDSWDNVQLQTTFLAPDDAGTFADPAPEVGGHWSNVPLTATATAALEAAVRIAAEYHLVPLPPAVLALGLLADPDGGAARALLHDAEIDHGQLLALVQDDALGVTLEGLDLGASSTKHGFATSALVRLLQTGVTDVEVPAAVRATDWAPVDRGGLGLLIRAVEDAAVDEKLRELLDAMLLTSDGLRESARGTGDLDDELADEVIERARLRFEVEDPDPAAIAAAAVLGSSPRITEVLHRLGISCPEVGAQLAEFRLRRHDDGGHTNRVFVASMLNGLATVATSVLVVLAAIEDVGDLWKLLFVPAVWTGYPQFGPFQSALLASVLALLVSPLAGLAHLIGIAADLYQASTERRMWLSRTGVHLSFAELRRVTQRFLSPRARRFQHKRQVQRARIRAVREGRADLSG